MLIELLEKYFHENPWYDLTNLDELIKLTGLDALTIKVEKLAFFFLFKKKEDMQLINFLIKNIVASL